jgi:gliding motility-associated-like protein
MKKFLFILLIFSIGSNAQTYDAPKILCAQQKTNTDITWDLPIVTCGAFVEYELFSSPNLTTTFTSIKKFSNSTSTFHSDLGVNVPRYYYMVSNYVCPGQTSKFSDTVLSTNDYTEPVIKRVSVENGKVVIEWYPNPEIQTYLYRITNSISIIDSVFGRLNTTYLDTHEDPNVGSVIYQIVAKDKCGGGPPGISDVSFGHKTIFIKKTEKPCEGSIELEWTPYIGWAGTEQVKEYRLFVKRNSEPEELVSIQTPESRLYTYTNYIVGDILKIRVQAINSRDTNIRSYSNLLNFKVNVVQKPRYFFISQISVLNHGVVHLEWITDELASVKSVTIKRGHNDKELLPVHTFNISGAMPKISLFNDSTANTSYPLFYEINLVDSCGQSSKAVIKPDIYLDAEQILFFENKLTWYDQKIKNSMVHKYHIFRNYGSGYSEIATVPYGTNTYIDNIESIYDKKGVMKYKVTSEYTLDTTPIYVNNFLSFSNEDSIIEHPLVHIPNAFKPEGVSKIFKPVVVFGNTDIYTMQIFNRWGAMVYESSSYPEGWNGMINGSLAPQDVYSFLIKLNDNVGTPIIKKGTVTLLR